MTRRHSIRGVEHAARPSCGEDLAQQVSEGAHTFGRLPPRLASDDLVETVPATPAPDPLGGKDPDAEWMVRYGIGML